MHLKPPTSPRLPRGLTLIELMVVLAGLALLTTLALPSWEEYLRRGRRSDAVTALSQLQQTQERWRAQHPTYATSLGPDGLALPGVSAAGFYELATTVSPDSATTAYRVTAVARGIQAADATCRWLAIDAQSGTLRHRSGTDARLDNDARLNRHCWGTP
jgi:type IV pilus assembly protein PilE